MRGVDRWASALLEVLLPEDRDPGTLVRLACDDVALAKAAELVGGIDGRPDRALVAELKAEALLTTEDGLGPLAAPRTGAQPPRYLVGLALLVLAATRMTADEQGAMQAYYTRLASLLELPLRDSWPGVGGMREMANRFDDLALWLAETEQGRRGCLDLDPDVQPPVVGKPIGQTVLRAGDRVALQGFFLASERLLDAGWDPIGQLRRWGGRHSLSLPLQQLLDRSEMSGALRSALRSARDAWDGSVRDRQGRATHRAQLKLFLPPGPLAVGISLPFFSHAVSLSAPQGPKLEITPGTESSLPLDWLEHAGQGPLVLRSSDEAWVRVLPERTILFELIGSASGLQGVESALGSPLWVLTCDDQLVERCSQNSRITTSLPTGWTLLCDVEPDLLGELGPGLGDGEAEGFGIEVEGGLRLSEETWLSGHPPSIRSALPEAAPVAIDERSYGDLEPREELRLEEALTGLGTHVVAVADQEASIELVDKGPRVGIGGLCWRSTETQHYSGAQPTEPGEGPSVCGARVTPTPTQVSPPTIVRYRCPVHVISIDGEVRTFAPPPPAAWHEHVGLPEGGAWEVPGGDRIAWLCVEASSGHFVVCKSSAEIMLSEEVLDLVEDFFEAERIVDHSGGGAEERWRGLLAELEAS